METATLATAAQFVLIAMALQREARRLGLKNVPAFRSHPHTGTRSLRRFPEQTVILIALGRDLHEVTRDCIDGVLAIQAESFDEETAQGLRDALWIAAGEAVAA